SYRFITNSTHLQGYEYLKDPEILLITKSFKDVIVAHTLGIQAVAVQSESVSPPKEIIDTFNCVWLGDQDYCGRKATIRIRDTFGIP
ncbi:hypothetical protein OEK97_28225, partial [Escherichia coli]|uniref:hypothetical protein n=1 Tax=Escherichia coli TaxID=562 RepID=UPI0021D85F12